MRHPYRQCVALDDDNRDENYKMNDDLAGKQYDEPNEIYDYYCTSSLAWNEIHEEQQRNARKSGNDWTTRQHK
jgi:hypothetical protein